MVGTKGAAGCGVMLEAADCRCLVTVVPLHVPAGGGLPLIVELGNLEPTQLGWGGWEGQVGAVSGSPSVFILFLWWTWQLLQRTAIAWLRHEREADLPAAAAGLHQQLVPLLRQPRCLRSGMRAWWSRQQLSSAVLGAQLSSGCPAAFGTALAQVTQPLGALGPSKHPLAWRWEGRSKHWWLARL